MTRAATFVKYKADFDKNLHPNQFYDFEFCLLSVRQYTDGFSSSVFSMKSIPKDTSLIILVLAEENIFAVCDYEQSWNCDK